MLNRSSDVDSVDEGGVLEKPATPSAPGSPPVVASLNCCFGCEAALLLLLLLLVLLLLLLLLLGGLGVLGGAGEGDGDEGLTWLAGGNDAAGLLAGLGGGPGDAAGRPDVAAAAVVAGDEGPFDKLLLLLRLLLLLLLSEAAVGAGDLLVGVAEGAGCAAARSMMGGLAEVEGVTGMTAAAGAVLLDEGVAGLPELLDETCAVPPVAAELPLGSKGGYAVAENRLGSYMNLHRSSI